MTTSLLQASKVSGLARSTITYISRRRDDAMWVVHLKRLVNEHPGIGIWKAFRRLRYGGYSINVDDVNRQALWIEPDVSLPAIRVIRVLEQLKTMRVLPRMLRVDNGPELVSNKLGQWCRRHDIELIFIEPGKPTQNTYIERFNRTLRGEVLNAYAFNTLREVRERIKVFIVDYYHNRPHDSLGYQTPIQLLQKYQSSNLQLQ